MARAIAVALVPKLSRSHQEAALVGLKGRRLLYPSHIHHRLRKGSALIAVSGGAILIDVIWNLIITRACCIELLNHEISTIM
jgi:hypothetical protein